MDSEAKASFEDVNNNRKADMMNIRRKYLHKPLAWGFYLFGEDFKSA